MSITVISVIVTLFSIKFGCLLTNFVFIAKRVLHFLKCETLQAFCD